MVGVRCVLFVVCCSLFGVCGLLRCSLCVVLACFVLFVVCCSMADVCCMLLVVCCS